MRKNTVALLVLSSFFGVQSFADSVSNLAWMKGEWSGPVWGGVMETYYSDTEGGMILGTTKLISDGHIQFHEFEKIEEQDGKVTLQPYPNGVSGPLFKSTTLNVNEVIFESSDQNDFPSRIIYRKESDGVLLCILSGVQAGKPLIEEFRLYRK